MEARATYNITNDKLKAWFPERLSDEDYQRMRKAGFTFWHGSKCFVAKWSPGAEDVLLSLGVEEIEEDDTPDDVESRVERFAKYAERAESGAESSEAYLAERANTKRRREHAINAIERQLSVAAHWQARIAGAVRHASRKERVDVIGRRIKGLETDFRRVEKGLKESKAYLEQWNAPDLTLQGAKALANYGHGANLWSDIDAGRVDLEQARERAIALFTKRIQWGSRWWQHLTNRLEYERAIYFAGGGTEEQLHPPRRKAVQPKGKATAKDGSAIEPFGAIGVRSYLGGTVERWGLVTKVNRTTVEVVRLTHYTNGPSRMHLAKVEAYEIQTAKSAQQVEAEHPDLVELRDRYKAAIDRQKARKSEVAA